MSHPISLAFLLMGVCGLIRLLILNFFYSWFFYLLFLMFLGGIIIIVIYITSLASNEKAGFELLSNGGFIFLGLRRLIFFDSRETLKLSSSFKFVGDFFEVESIRSLILCFILLLLAIISLVKVIKLEEGPMVKRL